MDWKRTVARIAAELESGVDRARHALARRSGEERPVRLVAYRGYGSTELVRVRGRVLHGRPPAPARPTDRWWVNLANAYRRLESDEVPGARVRVRFGGAEAEARTDDEGHFLAELRPRQPIPPERLWHEAGVELLAPGPAVEGTVTAAVAIPQRARFGVVSDLDDTVLRTDARNLLRMVREVLFGNVHTRIPFAGVGAFYRALHDDGRNPIFYVSSSPWNLYDLLAEFLRLHGIPPGAMELRDWGLSSLELLPTGHRDHKRKAIDAILDAFPDLPFILVGDSGQEDPEIYRELIHDRPGRILAVYIRSVVAEPLRIREVRELAQEIAEAHVELGDAAPELVLVENTMAAAQHAARRAWIDPARLQDVGRQRAAES